MSYQVTVTLGDVAAKNFEALAQGGRSTSEVIREALALETVFQRAMNEGATVIVRAPDGTEREIVRS